MNDGFIYGVSFYGHNDYRDYLAHHGVKGQEWGKRHGPPYPLAPSAHSASEKEAGWRSSLKYEGTGGADLLRAKKKRRSLREVLADRKTRKLEKKKKAVIDQAIKDRNTLGLIANQEYFSAKELSDAVKEVDARSKALKDVEDRASIRNGAEGRRQKKLLSGKAKKILKNFDQYSVEEIKDAKERIKLRDAVEDLNRSKMKARLEDLKSMATTFASIAESAKKIKEGYDAVTNKKAKAEESGETKKSNAIQDLINSGDAKRVLENLSKLSPDQAKKALDQIDYRKKLEGLAGGSGTEKPTNGGGDNTNKDTDSFGKGKAKPDEKPDSSEESDEKPSLMSLGKGISEMVKNGSFSEKINKSDIQSMIDRIKVNKKRGVKDAPEATPEISDSEAEKAHSDTGGTSKVKDAPEATPEISDREAMTRWVKKAKAWDKAWHEIEDTPGLTPERRWIEGTKAWERLYHPDTGGTSKVKDAPEATSEKSDEKPSLMSLGKGVSEAVKSISSSGKIDRSDIQSMIDRIKVNKKRGASTARVAATKHFDTSDARGRVEDYSRRISRIGSDLDDVTQRLLSSNAEKIGRAMGRPIKLELDPEKKKQD